MTSSPAPQRQTSSVHLTGIVTDDDGAAVAGATVTVQPWLYGAFNVPPVSGVTDGSGFYSIDFDANQDAVGGVAYVKGDGSGRDPSYYCLVPISQNPSQNPHLYRITRITAGESAVLTVLPGDTICGDNDQFVCRAIHIAVTTGGTLTLVAVPTQSATTAGLQVSGLGVAYQCCSLAATIPVTAGTEIVVSVGTWWTSTASQSFVLNTSLQTL
jgi:hypothetical protein